MKANKHIQKWPVVPIHCNQRESSTHAANILHAVIWACIVRQHQMHMQNVQSNSNKYRHGSQYNYPLQRFIFSGAHPRLLRYPSQHPSCVLIAVPWLFYRVALYWTTQLQGLRYFQLCTGYTGYFLPQSEILRVTAILEHTSNKEINDKLYSSIVAVITCRVWQNKPSRAIT